MAGITVILSLFDRNFALSLGLESDKGRNPQEMTVIESQASISQPVGFSRNEEEEDGSDRGIHISGRVPSSVRLRTS